MDAMLLSEALTFCDVDLKTQDDVFVMLSRRLGEGGYVTDTGWMPLGSASMIIRPGLHAKGWTWRYPIRTRGISSSRISR